jgi:hypothetical protein
VDLNTKTVILERKKKIRFTVWDVRHAGTFSQGLFYANNHVCIFALVNKLLKYAGIFEFGTIVAHDG